MNRSIPVTYTKSRTIDPDLAPAAAGRHAAPEKWDTVEGYCFFIRNSRNSIFPMLSTFGLTVGDAIKRCREMHSGRRQHNRRRVETEGLARVTLITNEKILTFPPGTDWEAASLKYLARNPELQSKSLAD
jgi:hypothetical protein